MRDKLSVRMDLGISDIKNLVCPFFYDFLGNKKSAIFSWLFCSKWGIFALRTFYGKLLSRIIFGANLTAQGGCSLNKNIIGSRQWQMGEMPILKYYHQFS